ncbi:hypothetical protein BDY21DRAFT_345387 [Lineolata rhizophorae]|uniref:Uncharacterized protein n=1 Tax=Lineolata rhizophorae TaxID=578093 RepID=A0A6A6P0E3_9PEZI|nr:hypothetical protein BDY21DRAFT_345387 [Lineolata rhizophorae]
MNHFSRRRRYRAPHHTPKNIAAQQSLRSMPLPKTFSGHPRVQPSHSIVRGARQFAHTSLPSKTQPVLCQPNPAPLHHLLHAPASVPTEPPRSQTLTRPGRARIRAPSHSSDKGLVSQPPFLLLCSEAVCELPCPRQTPAANRRRWETKRAAAGRQARSR